MGFKRTAELLTQLVNTKKSLVDKLKAKGADASFNEPFADLVNKVSALDTERPSTYILRDAEGTELVATVVGEETIFTATANDIRAGKVAATDTGVVTGEKVIPSYNTTEGVKIVTAGSKYKITNLDYMDLYKFTKLQAIICDFNSSLSNSVAANKVSINGKVYDVKSVIALSTVTVNETDKTIDLGIINETDSPKILKYFTYKEIY